MLPISKKAAHAIAVFPTEWHNCNVAMNYGRACKWKHKKKKDFFHAPIQLLFAHIHPWAHCRCEELRDEIVVQCRGDLHLLPTNFAWTFSSICLFSPFFMHLLLSASYYPAFFPMVWVPCIRDERLTVSHEKPESTTGTGNSLIHLLPFLLMWVLTRWLFTFPTSTPITMPSDEISLNIQT